MAVDNTKRVTGKVTALSVTRNGNTMKVSWKIPASMTDENRADRATWLDSNMYFTLPSKCDSPRSPTSGQIWYTGASAAPSGAKYLDYTGYDEMWIKGIGLNTSYEKPFDRSRYYPCSKGMCNGVVVGVHGGNGSGVGGWDANNRNASGRGPDATAVYNFELPKAPALSTPELDTSTGHLSCTMDLKSEGNKERYDSRYRMLRRDNFNANYKSFAAIADWVATQANSVEPSVDVSDFDALTQGQWVEVKFEAYSRGMAGYSATSSRTRVFAWPAQPVITSVTASSLSAGGIVTIKVNTRASEHAPVDSIELERRKGDSGSWESVSTGRDNGKSSGFSDSAADALSGVSAGTHVYYRVKAIHDSFQLYSEPFDALCLYRELPKGSAIVFSTVESTASADGVRVLMGWNAESTEYTGTEVTWSDKPDAWTSSNKPASSEVTWKDATSRVSGKNRSAEFTIYELTQGTPYYIRARRYLEIENGRRYGEWCSPTTSFYPYIPTTVPTSAELTVQSYIPRGSDVPLSWTFNAPAEQRGWALWLVGTEDEVIASGDDAYGATTVPANRFEGMDSAEMYIAVTTGSGWAYSAHRTVRFADPPTITAEVGLTDGALTEQPVGISLAGSTGDDEVRVRITSNGVSSAMPSGDADQVAGYVLFDAWTMPTWYQGRDGILAEMELPEGLPFVDNGTYTLEIWARNRTTGLVSKLDPVEFEVAWSHQAVAPTSVTVTPYDADRVVVVQPSAPDGAAETDVFDLYRVTPDSVDLVAEGLPFGSAASDRYAPFGGAYRIATRTLDGDMDWLEAEFSMPCKFMRLDWGESHIELPHNLQHADQWEKGFERRAHLDGSRAGFWNEGANRDATLSTALIRIRSDEEKRLMRSLATYSGPCFVRLPDGVAYQANVDVSGLSESYSSGAVDISLAVHQVDLTDEFKVDVTEVDYA